VGVITAMLTGVTPVANGILVFWDIFPWSLITVRGISIICGTGRRERELRKFLRRRADGVEKLG